jgi:uncharacterized protein (TIGR03437 family)
LLYVSSTQINFAVPDGTAKGAAQFVVTNGSATQSFSGTVAAVDPTLFSMNGTGSGVSAATTQVGTSQTVTPVYQCTSSACVAVPITLASGTSTYLTLYGTGIRGRSALANVTVTIGTTAIPAQYAGPTPNFTGLDQVNILLPDSLRGSGQVNLFVTVDGQASNAVTIDIQ